MRFRTPPGRDDKGDLVEFLLRRQFPGSWAPPPIQPLRPNGLGGGTDPNAVERHNIFMTRVEAERKRLWGLDASELLAMQAAETEKDKAKHEAELAKLDAVFHRVENAADFDYWTKAEYWTFDESIALLIGKNPKTLNGLLVDGGRAPLAQRYMKLRELARRASAMQGPRLRPSQVLAWADSIGVDVPSELRALPTPPAQTLASLGITAQPERLTALDAELRAQREPATQRMAREPDWDLWADMRRLRVWQAVALSLNINPGLPDMSAATAATMRDPARLRRFGAEFERRLAIALSQLSTDGPLRPLELYTGVLEDPCAMVSMKNFATFVQGLRKPWALPAGFPQSVGPAAPASAPVGVSATPETTTPAAVDVRWTDEELAKLAAYRKEHGTKKAADHFNISTTRVRQLLPGAPSEAPATANNPFNIARPKGR